MNRWNTSLMAVLSLAALCVAGDASAQQQLYVGNDNPAGGVQQFNLPVGASTTPNVTIASPNVVAVDVDSHGTLALADFAGNLKVFSRPLATASTPSASFKNGAASNDGQIVFTQAGDFFAATVGNRVNFFTHPFSNASTPSLSITNAAMVSVIGATLDAAQNLYLGNAGVGSAVTCSSGAGSCSNLLIYASPYTAAPIVTPPVASAAYRKAAVGATQLFIASVAGTLGRVDVYNLPITATSVPAFAITTGVNAPEGLAVDAAGPLYVGNLSDATVAVYAPPFSALSAPTVTLKVSTGAYAIFGIAIGNSQPLRREAVKR
jgi:hypothetical protein